jgi:hypothetical protein
MSRDQIARTTERETAGFPAIQILVLRMIVSMNRNMSSHFGHVAGLFEG